MHDRVSQNQGDGRRPIAGETEQREPQDQIRSSLVGRQRPGLGNPAPAGDPGLFPEKDVERARRFPGTRATALGLARRAAQQDGAERATQLAQHIRLARQDAMAGHQGLDLDAKPAGQQPVHAHPVRGVQQPLRDLRHG